MLTSTREQRAAAFTRACFLPLSAESRSVEDCRRSEHIQRRMQLDLPKTGRPAGAAELSPAQPAPCAGGLQSDDWGAGMTQASDLGGSANQLAAFYRALVNVNLQALATLHYGSSEPPLI
jgi:hypothetical protein